MNLFFIFLVISTGLFLALPWWQALPVFLVLLVAYLITSWWARRAQRNRPLSGQEAMIGARAVVVGQGTGRLRVRYRGEVWWAESAQTLKPGQEVVILEVKGLMLRVAPSGRR
jgi:membrane protein implicated in regulation of membrane protease activity